MRAMVPMLAALLVMAGQTESRAAASPAAVGARKAVPTGSTAVKTTAKRNAVRKPAAKATSGLTRKRGIAYKSGGKKITKTAYAAMGIANMRHAKDTNSGRMSTAADLSKDTVKNFGRRAAARYGAGTIVISNYTRRLYYITGRGKSISYPIATPRPNEIWTGVTRISEKRVNPEWTPTPDMREKDPELPEKVDGGSPANPLGPRALYLGSSVYRIHGTNSPGSIGRPASGGCYRMHNNNIVSLYNMVGVGTKVVVTNARAL